MTHPPSHAATPLMHNTSVTGKEGPAALMKLMSQPHQLMKTFNLQVHPRYTEWPEIL